MTRRTPWLFCALTVGLSGLHVGCARHQPTFTEPAWGSAPDPYPSEVVEITFEHRHCARNASACTFERAVLLRDGRATRTVQNPSSPDSVQVGTIDSLTFTSLGGRLRDAGFFRRVDGYPRHEPLATDSFILTAASYCRRAIQGYTQSDFPGSSPPALVEAIRVALLTVPWAQCCRARR